MTEKRQKITIEGKEYAGEDLSQDIVNNLSTLQQGEGAIQMLSSLIRLAQVGSDHLSRQTKKLLPEPAAAEGLRDSVKTSDEVTIETH